MHAIVAVAHPAGAGPHAAVHIAADSVGAALGILTLGMYYQTPIKAYSTIYVMIVDSRDNNVAFFRKSYLQDREPIDESVLVKQYNKIFEGYFLAKQ